MKPPSSEGEDFKIIINPHVQKMQKLQNQLEAFMHGKRHARGRDHKAISSGMEIRSLLEKCKSLKLEFYDGEGSPN